MVGREKQRRERERENMKGREEISRMELFRF
jgi:hypothetical protein